MIGNPRAYNAAIALNNAGVLLIQRRMPLEAVATIQDSLRLMRYSFFGESTEDGQAIPLPAVVCDDALQAAWKRTSLSKVQDQHSPQSLRDKQVCIVTDHDNPSIVYETLVRTSATLCVIKIDPLEGLIGCEDMMKRLEVESSIMLYNYAIASSCIVEEFINSANHVRQNAMKIMKLAQSGVTKLLNDSLSLSDSPADIPSSLLLVAMLVLDTLFHMSNAGKINVPPGHSQPSHSTQAYADDLTVILTAISEREIVFSQEGNGLTSAAPAA